MEFDADPSEVHGSIIDHSVRQTAKGDATFDEFERMIQENMKAEEERAIELMYHEREKEKESSRKHHRSHHFHSKKSKKKKSKGKKHKKTDSSADDSSSEDEESMWVEKGTEGEVSSQANLEAPPQAKAQHMEWMLKPMARSTPKEPKPKEEEPVKAPSIAETRELNPNLNKALAEDAKPAAAQGVSAAWRQKALRRLRERAETEGGSFAQEIQARFGLDATVASVHAEIRKDRGREREADRSRRGPLLSGSRGKMLRPDDDVNDRVWGRSRDSRRGEDSRRFHDRNEEDKQRRKDREREGRDRDDGRREREGRDRSDGKKDREREGRDRNDGKKDREREGRDRNDGRRDREREGRDRDDGLERGGKMEKEREEAEGGRKREERGRIAAQDEGPSRVGGGPEPEDHAAAILTPPALPPLPDANKLQAKALKMEMLGRMDEYRKLQEEILAVKAEQERRRLLPQPPANAGGPRSQRRAQEEEGGEKAKEKEKDVVIVDMFRPAAKRENRGVEERTHIQRKKVEQYEAGERVRYFADDDNISLEDMVRKEREESGHAYARAEQRAIASNSRYTAAANTDDSFDTLDERSYGAGKADRLTHAEKNQRQHKASLHRAQQVHTLQERCLYCLGQGKQLYARLLVAQGYRAYLALPALAPLTPGHCMVVPRDHALSLSDVDPDTYDEIRNFQKSLAVLCHEQGMAVLFVETVMPRSLKTQRHTVMEAFPIPAQLEQAARGYFKKAFLEGDEEWAQHKKLYETSKEKPIFRTIPANFPYVHVQFGVGGCGYAHVIEDEEMFTDAFAYEVIAGLLRLDPALYKSRKLESPSQQEARAKEFKQHFDRYDWTKSLSDPA